MPSYEYIAIDPTGKRVKGTIDADNVRTARQRLRGQGIYPTDIKEGIDLAAARSSDVKLYFQSNRIPARELAVLTRQLATLLNAGLPLVAALQALSEQTDSPASKRTIVDVRENVEEGAALAKSLNNFPKSFPRLYVNMVAAGEASGNLDAVLDNLANYLEAQMELRRNITSALFYPALMLGLCTLVVLGLVMFVVPMIVEIFQKQGAILPLPTRIMIGISNFAIYYWYIPLLLIIGMVVGLRRYKTTPAGKEKIDLIMLRIPVFRTLYRKIATARVARTLGTLLSSGVGLLVALDIARNIVNNVHIQRAIENARDGVREGKSLAKELAKSGQFPTLLSHMIAIGETSGRLEAMLEKAGQAYENEANSALKGLTTLIEPLMIIGVGIIVFCIVISILMPMLDLISVIGK